MDRKIPYCRILVTVAFRNILDRDINEYIQILSKSNNNKKLIINPLSIHYCSLSINYSLKFHTSKFDRLSIRKIEISILLLQIHDITADSEYHTHFLTLCV